MEPGTEPTPNGDAMFNRAVKMALAAGTTMAIAGAGAVVLPGGQAPVQATVQASLPPRPAPAARSTPRTAC
jgi:hypothetical protein